MSGSANLTLPGALAWVALSAAGCRHAVDAPAVADASDDGRARDAELTIWQPAVGTTWQWQLTGALDDTFEVETYDVDLLNTSAEEIGALRDAGRRVICYFSAGTYEPWRDDAALFPQSDRGSALDPPFGDELWLDTRSDAVREVLRARLDVAQERGCDAVEPDNVDAYANDNGLGLSDEDQLDFNRFLADEAHARGLSVGLKNDLDQLAALEPSFDWALNEQCVEYEECEVYVDNFLAAGKAVFHAEYFRSRAETCAVTAPLGISTIVKNIELDAPRADCL